MTTITTTRPTTTVQQIILTQHADLMKDIASFLALSLFIAAVLIWAY